MTEPKKQRSFWSRPEGVTGGVVIAAVVLLIMWGGIMLWQALSAFLTTGMGLTVGLIVLGLTLFMVLDPKMRNLLWYFYKKSMRWLTGLFIRIDPISVLKRYVENLKSNVVKMRRQMAQLRGQMHQLQEITHNNGKLILENLEEAAQAREREKKNVMIVKSRKAARLQDSNERLQDLYNRMEVLYRVLGKMYENSEILLEDIEDQVQLKEQERKAILAGRSAMESAMSVIKGDGDKRESFDRALEAVAEDVSQKVGEMEEFMEMSESFMNSIDLENGIFQERGLEMLEKWEKDSSSLLTSPEQYEIKLPGEDETLLDLNKPVRDPEKDIQRRNQYDSFFD